MQLDELLQKIQDKDPTVRTAAWQQAGTIGAPAVKPLAALLASNDAEIAGAARHGLRKIVRTAGAPGSAKTKPDVVRELLALLDGKQPVAGRRELLWLLSEIGGQESVAPIAALLSHEELREDARAALERIPGEDSLAALCEALSTSPPPFLAALVQSLRARGMPVDPAKYPCRKLVPTR